MTVATWRCPLPALPVAHDADALFHTPPLSPVLTANMGPYRL